MYLGVKKTQELEEGRQGMHKRETGQLRHQVRPACHDDPTAEHLGYLKPNTPIRAGVSGRQPIVLDRCFLPACLSYIAALPRQDHCDHSNLLPSRWRVQVGILSVLFHTSLCANRRVVVDVHHLTDTLKPSPFETLATSPFFVTTGLGRQCHFWRI